jgi:hypothetical protein
MLQLGPAALVGSSVLHGLFGLQRTGQRGTFLANGPVIGRDLFLDLRRFSQRIDLLSIFSLRCRDR